MKYRHFSKAFAAHFELVQRGERTFYVSCNGMSLNSLAESVEDEDVKLDASKVSRFISGDRIPTSEQFGRICRDLELSDTDENLLLMAIVKDLAESGKFDFDVTMDKRVIELMLRDSDRLRAAMDKDDFDSALEFLRDLRDAPAKFATGDTLPPSLMRIFSVAENGRGELMDTLSQRAGLQDPLPNIVGIAEAYKVADLIEEFAMPEEVAEIARRYFLDGIPPEDIAEEDGLTIATVLSVIQEVKEKLLQHIAGAADKSDAD